jgi:hypothetical protein
MARLYFERFMLMSRNQQLRTQVQLASQTRESKLFGPLRHFLSMATLLLASTIVTQASGAIIIDAGPTWAPPGFGTGVGSGTGAAYAGGKTWTYSSIDLGATANLYYGLKVDAFTNGFSMDGGVDASSAEIFRYNSHSGSTVEYTGSTLVRFDGGAYSSPYNTRLTVVITGTGSLIQDATTASYNSAANGDVEVMWDVQSDFFANFLIEVESPANTWTPGNDFYNALGGTGEYGTGTSFDDGFYYQNIPEPVSAALACFGLFGLMVHRRRG